MGLELLRGPNQEPAISDSEKSFFERLMNAASYAMFNGLFKPIRSNFSLRELTILAEIEVLIRILNRGEVIPENWKDQVIVVEESRLQLLPTPFELVNDEAFTRDPDFILKWKDIPQKSLFHENLKKQVKEIQNSRYFLRYLYKLAVADNEYNVEDIDESLEGTGRRMDLHHDIFVPSALQRIKRAFLKEYFCTKCALGFADMKDLLSHMAKFHVDWVSAAAQEEIRSAREAVKLAEQYEAQKCIHNNNHPNCDMCFHL